ncbi:T-complex 11 [Penicillium griseofulvum]|uniref:T-complex 11 n=1 Tax=Penicillium patulum TaxID=5078 RepID=A0A135LUD4_PENPA|nr:T-complex 11 [Penicillium griseofulvum]KXG52556.1 T-complex 11 [Penicillium griseofulvum]
MDLQGTKEARPQEEGAEGPLEAYGAGGGRSKEYHKKEGRDSHNHDERTSIHPLRRRQPPFAYPHGNRQTASPVPAVVPRLREPSPSPEAISIPQDLGLSSRDQRLLRKARRSPPVTKKTLSELDLPCIMSNINLRMDANFDRDLHFKPDLDGEKGQRKRKEAADYWDSLAVEITIYSFLAATADVTTGQVESSDGTRHSFDPRLPALFETLQDVIKTLVPERDHPTIMQNLEVPLLMQQIRKGVLDMLTLAKWLAKLLKTHCAPMRDEWADSMVEQIQKGSQSQDPQEIVNGLRTLFSILEAMKLDVANHQIRAFRVLLIEDTVPFLQEYFQGKITRGSFQVEAARHWYLSVREQARLDDANAEAQKTTTIPETEESLKPLEALFRGISSQLLQFTPPAEFPETFLFDSERLWQLRSTVQNLINLDIAWYIFESYVNKHKRYLSTPEETYSTFRSRIWSLMEDGMDLENRVAGNPDNNDDDPDHRGGKRWTQNMRCIALEIARFACAALQLDPVVADEVIAPIEEALEWHLSNESELFVFFQNSMRSKILATTLVAARKYLPLSPLAICESQRVPLSATMGPTAPQTGTAAASGSVNTFPVAISPQQSDIERIGMRLAHMGVLHWRVWAPLLYLRDEIAISELEQVSLV